MPWIPLSFPFHKGKDPPDVVTVNTLATLLFLLYFLVCIKICTRRGFPGHSVNDF